MKFEEVLPALRDGERLVNSQLSAEGGFIVRHVPQTVPAEFVPKMTSLPDSAKEHIARAGGSDISFYDQILLVHWSPMQEDYRATSWAPSCHDLFREDWTIA